MPIRIAHAESLSCRVLGRRLILVNPRATWESRPAGGTRIPQFLISVNRRSRVRDVIDLLFRRLPVRQSMKLTFLGATETVTGSKYLVEHGGRRVLVDCGLFQGTKNLRLRNWRTLPLAPDTLDAVVLTHAHIDHTGYLPVLVREGYRGPVYCTAATAELCDIMLRDSARLQEEEADFANRHGYSKHHPAQPLYTLDDAQRALR
ncbi:MBL fold metallo-hydrolase, partial [Burkholderia multivorans]|uniref:MBL fold metallo-hydrolase n=1 Tax=Burkholderia multivorans TaxID=87883 RepID=UPI0028707CAD